MASRYTHDVVATTGEYKNNQGETKKRFTNVGCAFTDDQGRVSIKLDSIPVGPDWSGWLSLYDPKPRDGQHSAPQQQQAPAQNKGLWPGQGGVAPAAADDDTGVPF